MICIFLEGLLVEFSILILGKNLVGYMVGGGLAVSTALLYKIINWIVIYGFSIVKIYVNMYDFAAKQLMPFNFSASQLVWLLIFIYLLFGVAAAVIGFFTGQQSLKNEKKVFHIPLSDKKEMFRVDMSQSFSLLLLFLHPILIVAGIVNINFLPIYYALIFLAAYIGFCISKYRTSLRRLQKPMLWFQLFAFTILAALFIKGIRSGGNIFNYEGLIAGLKMNLRAIFMIIGLAALSVEFRNPKIKNAFSGKSYDSLYMSLELSFEALPSIMKSLNKPKDFIRYPMRSIAFLINQAEGLLNDFQEKTLETNSLIIITGKRGEGKTTFLKKITSALKAEGLETKGFLSSAVYKDGEKIGYRLLSISDNTEMNFISVNEHFGEINLGKYYFSDEGLEWGNNILKSYNGNDNDILIIDEIGPLELSGKGWSESLDNLATLTQFNMIWVVRKEFLDEVINKWNLSNPVIIDISSISISEAKKTILKIFL